MIWTWRGRLYALDGQPPRWHRLRPLAGGTCSAVLVQRAFRGRNNTQDETSDGTDWKANENNNWNQSGDEIFRVRFEVEETANCAGGDQSYVVQYRRYTSGSWGSWTIVTTSTSVCKLVDSDYMEDDEATTDQLTTSAMSFLAGRVDENGTVTNINLKNKVTELEYVLQIVQADVVAGDLMEFRVVISGGTALTTYAATPQVTIQSAVDLLAATPTGTATVAAALTTAITAKVSLTGTATVAAALTTAITAAASLTGTATVTAALTATSAGGLIALSAFRWGRHKPPPGTRLSRAHPRARGLNFVVLANEGGGQPRDLVSGAFGAVITNPVSWGVGEPGRLLVYSTAGNTRRPQWNTPASVLTSNRATVAILSRMPDTGASERHLVSRWGSTEDWKLWINSSAGTLGWTHRNASGTAISATSTGTSYDDNTWRWVFGGTDGSNARLVIVDRQGGLLENVTGTASASVRSLGTTISLGNTDSGSANDFGGEIALVLIWPTRWLTLGEMQAQVLEPYVAVATPRRWVLPLAQQGPALLAASLDGSATLGSTLTTAITAAASLTGTATLTLALTSQITAAVALTGAATVAAPLTTTIALVASPTGAATVAAPLTTAITAAASLTGTAALAPDLTTSILLASAVTGTATLDADLTAGTVDLLAVELTGIGTVAADLTTSITAEASLTGTATVAAAVTTAITMQGALTGSASVAPALTTEIPLVSALTGTASLDLALTSAITAAASLTGTATIAAPLTTAIPLIADLTGTATLAAAATTQITAAADLTGSATLAADLTTQILCVGDLIGTATVTADLTAGTVDLLATTLAGTGTVAASLTTVIAAQAALAGAATLTAGLTTQITAASVLSAAAVLAPALTTEIRCVTAIVGEGTLAAAVTTVIACAVTLEGDGTVHASLTGGTAIAGPSTMPLLGV